MLTPECIACHKDDTGHVELKGAAAPASAGRSKPVPASRQVQVAPTWATYFVYDSEFADKRETCDGASAWAT